MSTKPSTMTATSPAFEISRRLTRLRWATPTVIFAADLSTLLLVFGITAAARHLVKPTDDLWANIQMLPYLIVLLAAFGAKGLYPGILLHPAEEMRRVFVCVTSVFLLMGAITFVWRNAEAYSRSIFLITWAAGAPVLLLSRYLVRRNLGNRDWWGIPAVVLGSGPIAERVVRKLQDGMLGIKVVGILSDEYVPSWPDDLPSLLGRFSATRALADVRASYYAIIALPGKPQFELREIIQHHCQGFSHVLLIPDMPGLCSMGASLREIDGELGVELPQRLFHKGAGATKRILDLLFGSLALLATLPLFAATAIAIKLTSPGPVFYRHERIGKGGKKFGALKFRTMVPNAEQVLNDHLARHQQFLFEWNRDRKLKDDPRVTAVGKWLRRFSMDELPQICNVLGGKMSLVGPRPLPPGDLEKYGGGFDLYSRVLPGITGLWQVSGRNNTTYEERVAFDEYYVRNWSIWLDTYILISTIRAVLTAEGAY